ncbi:hypothetical protein [Aureimonas sp. SA4125]|uniref:hypothetical protein n=1 Tax=Aureimonas sp. SA4125 TaxID=2826993 RepID=UPI001CC76D78|nr:hypothetical protein [Aureimonas sp. SA4125]
MTAACRSIAATTNTNGRWASGLKKPVEILASLRACLAFAAGFAQQGGPAAKVSERS